MGNGFKTMMAVLGMTALMAAGCAKDEVVDRKSVV